jgi:hypothetical protein
MQHIDRAQCSIVARAALFAAALYVKCIWCRPLQDSAGRPTGEGFVEFGNIDYCQQGLSRCA